jgi:anti-sigma regulatory factor (Ser/Thr protein kinase)
VGTLAEGGRGMLIIDTLADDFGWRRLPDGHGKVMWFALAIPPANAKQ